MQRDTLRYLALIAFLALGASATLLQRGHESDPIAQDQNTEPRYVFHIDVADWYRTTPDEVVIVSSYDLRPSALPESLPLTLHEWQGTNLGPDEEIETWYAHPDLVVRRCYEDGAGHLLWLTIISSHGPKSFHLFEHTPHTCYHSQGWTVLQDDIHKIALTGGTFPVRRGTFERRFSGHEGTKHVVYYWYQWDSPRRDAAEGMASWRLTTDAGEDSAIAEVRLDDLLRLLFDEVVPWNRF